MKKQTEQEAKSTVSFDLYMPISGKDVTTSEKLKGNGQPPLYDRVQIEELRYFLHSPNEHCRDEQEAKDHLVDEYSELLSLIFFIHVCGYTAKDIDVHGRNFTLSPIHYGFNNPTAPTSKRIIHPHGVTKDEDLTDPTQHSLTLDLIDQATVRAKCAYP
ncbi:MULTISPECIES: DUF4043 family protein [unclassified Bartonella]|uniref:DUF4043 family protein n=1 Tax=unclassified Bartonella TaxID=2645622 RepID=UPI00235EA29F